MARVHKKLPVVQRAGKEKYPWVKWLDGRVWELIQDEDFDLELHSFQTMIHQSARRYSVKVQTRTVGTSIYIQSNTPAKESK